MSAELPKIAIIGTGWGLRVLAPALESAGFNIAAIWARTEEKVTPLKTERSNAVVSTDLDAVLAAVKNDPALVCVVSPPFMHAAQVKKILAANQHVLCEKPMVLNTLEAKGLLVAAKAKPDVLQLLDHELRFLPAVQQMRERLRKGYCGRLQVVSARVATGSLLHESFDWWCDARQGGGVLGALGSHLIDLIAFLTEKKVERVQATLRTYHKAPPGGSGIVTSDDYGHCMLYCEDKLVVTIDLNTHCPGKFVQTVMVMGDKGRLCLDGSELHGCQRGRSGEALLHRSDTETSPYVQATQCFATALKRFFLAGGTGEQLSTAASFTDGLYTQSVIDALRQASQNGGMVEVEDVEAATL